MPEGRLFLEKDVARKTKPRSPSEGPPRFEYNPDSFLKRLFTSVGAKNQLLSSKIVLIEYRVWLRWVLVALLLLITVFFSPQLIPRWLGFRWSTTKDICENRKEKLDLLKTKMYQLSNVTQGQQYVNRINYTLACFEKRAELTWTGKGSKPLYPYECTPENAKVKTTEKEVCVGGEVVSNCAKLFGIKLSCVKTKTPVKCEKIVASDPAHAKRLAELQVWQEQQIKKLSSKLNVSEAEEIAETADKAGQRIVQRLLLQVDIASNLYTLYSIIAIIIGTPVIIFRRERKSSVKTFLFNMQRAQFMVIVVVILTLFDSGAKLILDTNFSRMLKNFQNDPCYLDPKFSRARLELVQSTCGNIAAQRSSLDELYVKISNVSYHGQLCEVADVRGVSHHPSSGFIFAIEYIRNNLKSEEKDFWRYPASCNATLLNDATSAPLDVNMSWFEAFFGSGVFAQLLLKSVITGFIVNLISFIEPMTPHNGMVEIFGLENDSKKVGLSKEEEISVRRYARDKNLFPLILSSMVMAFEIAIVIYSFIIMRTRSKEGIIQTLTIDAIPTPLKLNCSYVGAASAFTRPLKVNF